MKANLLIASVEVKQQATHFCFDILWHNTTLSVPHLTTEAFFVCVLCCPVTLVKCIDVVDTFVQKCYSLVASSTAM